MSYDFEDHEEFSSCQYANSHWVNPDGEDLYGCEISGIIADNPKDLGCSKCMEEYLKEQQQYHDDIDAAWNAAKGIR